MVDYIILLGDWFLVNLNNILSSAVTIILGYLAYRILVKQIGRLKSQKKLKEDLTYSLTKISKWLMVLIVFSFILGQFGVTLALFSGFVAIFGGTILGFASINTIGNAISGLVVMLNRPIGVGDRILFKGQLADIEGVELIYTKMRTLDNVVISVPNQELLKTEIVNYGNKTVIRRTITVTPGYEWNNRDVENALLDAIDVVRGVLKDPKPYVRITRFLDYAVEYKLYIFIDDIKRVSEIEANLHRAILETCKLRNIDIRTPLLTQQIQAPNYVNEKTEDQRREMVHSLPLPPSKV